MNGQGLLEQAEHGAAALVRLGEHGLRRLEEYVVLRVLRHLFRHIRITNRGLGALDVLACRREVAARIGETALDGTDGRLLVERLLQCIVEDVDCRICLRLRGDVELRAVGALETERL